MLLAFNDRGHRIGQGHQNARYSDREVELVHQLYEQGMSIGEISKLMGIPRPTIYDYCTGRGRCQMPARYKDGR